jgi:hypothetical protein
MNKKKRELHMSIGVMKDSKPKRRNLHSSQTLGWSLNWNTSRQNTNWRPPGCGRVAKCNKKRTSSLFFHYYFETEKKGFFLRIKRSCKFSQKKNGWKKPGVPFGVGKSHALSYRAVNLFSISPDIRDLSNLGSK